MASLDTIDIPTRGRASRFTPEFIESVHTELSNGLKPGSAVVLARDLDSSNQARGLLATFVKTYKKSYPDDLVRSHVVKSGDKHVAAVSPRAF